MNFERDVLDDLSYLERPITLVSSHASFRVLRNAHLYRKFFGFLFKFKFALCLNNYILISKSSLEKQTALIERMRKKYRNYLWDTLNRGYQLYYEIESIDKSLSFKEFFEKWKYSSLFSVFPFSAEKVLEKEIIKLLEKRGLNKEEIDKALFEISQPLNKTPDGLERENLFRIAKEKLKGKEVSRLIEEHAKNFWYINFAWMCGEELKPDDVEEKVNQLLKFVKNWREDKPLSVDELAEKYKIDEDLIRLSKEYVYFRTFRHYAIQKPLLEYEKEHFSDLDFPYYDVNWFTVNEIEERKFDKRVLESRKRKYFHGFYEDTYILKFGRDVDPFAEKLNTYIKERIKSKNVIKGNVANNAGVVRGTVKIVREFKDVAKVNEGDIVVAPMTEPSFSIALHRAKAFITDEGGILSHAALISRELNKTCIIGTRIATSLLKDGDIVEINPYKGEVILVKKCCVEG